MKTMMNLDGTKIVRVSDEKASRLFGEGYKYIAKYEDNMNEFFFLI